MLDSPEDSVLAQDAGAAGVVRWMLHQGRHMTHMREFGDEMCRRIGGAGIPLWRAFCGVGTLHPLVAAAAYVWRRGEVGAVRRTAGHGLRQTAEYQASPLFTVEVTRRMLRRKLEAADCPMDYPLLVQYKAEGGTDYVAMPLIFSDGTVNTITWATDRPGGFSATDIDGLREIAEALAALVEVQASRRIAQILLNTYVGRRTGQRVLSGAITRGSSETMRAVIWFCDLRGFTALADSMPQDRLLSLLNDYFEIMVGAVNAQGGEVLKFVGDAMLAIFELGEGEAPQERAGAALAAARGAIKNIAERNTERRAKDEPELRFGIALHLGEVAYGNIGAPDRLDFTVIGPAVNHANRLEKLAGELGRQVVASASFAAAAPETLESLGQHRLRGVSEAQDVFAIAV